jgi:hypothetical protein
MLKMYTIPNKHSAFIFQVVFLGQSPTLWSVLGAFIISMCAVAMGLRRYFEGRRAAAEEKAAENALNGDLELGSVTITAAPLSDVEGSGIRLELESSSDDGGRTARPRSSSLSSSSTSSSSLPLPFGESRAPAAAHSNVFLNDNDLASMVANSYDDDGGNDDDKDDDDHISSTSSST